MSCRSIDKVTAALGEIPFEFIVVDDNSPDGTAAVVKETGAPAFQCALHPPHRPPRPELGGDRGHFGSSAAPYFAVIDADHQHDERILPQMLDKALAGDDIVVGTRYAGGGAVGEGLSRRARPAAASPRSFPHLVTGETLSDPMSGFFLMRREVFDEVAASLSNEGFKILLDIIVSASRVAHAARQATCASARSPYTFRPRHAGESKMSPLVVVQFLGLVVSEADRRPAADEFPAVRRRRRPSACSCTWLTLVRSRLNAHFNFVNAQVIATVVSMTFNFVLNNELTYADKKLRGWRFLGGAADLLRHLLDRRDRQRLGGDLDLRHRPAASGSPASPAR